jgi:hypothetical protein
MFRRIHHCPKAALPVTVMNITVTPEEKFRNTGCSFCRLITGPEHLIGRRWYLPAN